MKYTRGPFYPDLQWDLDRLTAQGLVEIRLPAVLTGDEMPGHSHDSFQSRWSQGSYLLTADGFEAVTQILRAPAASRMHRFLIELAAAFGRLREETRTNAALRDSNYGDPLKQSGTLIDFAEWDQQNYTEVTAHAFARFAPLGVRLNRREKVHLYLRYLERLVSGEPA